jgi:prepilin-type N-terminal cleavage/methylation domain-containing protein
MRYTYIYMKNHTQRAHAHTNPGFTLLELLLVVGMLTMLMAYVGLNLFSNISKGRDARRLQDVKDIQKALQIAFITDKRYPLSPTEIVINGTDVVTLRLLSATDPVAKQAITDPLSDGTHNYWYQSSANGTTYQIRYCQENAQAQARLKKDCTNIMTP